MYIYVFACKFKPNIRDVGDRNCTTQTTKSKLQRKSSNQKKYKNMVYLFLIYLLWSSDCSQISGLFSSEKKQKKKKKNNNKLSITTSDLHIRVLPEVNLHFCSFIR